MSGPHPSDRVLAAFLDVRLDADRAAEVSQHVDICRRCQLRVGLAAPAVITNVPDEVATDDWVEVVDDSDGGDPVPGTIWRLAWDSDVMLVVIWGIDGDRISVLPVVDHADADDWCLLMGATATEGSLGELAVSVALETTVPWVVLDSRVAFCWNTDQLSELRRSYRTGRPAALPTGDPIRSPLDERLIGLDEVAERLNAFSNADAFWGPLAAQSEQSPPDFQDLIRAGLSTERAFDIAVHHGLPTEDEAAAIEAATGRRVTSEAVVSLDTRRAIDRPRRKAKITAEARAHNRTEAEERLAIAWTTEPQRAAARGTGGAPPDVEVILDRLLGD